MGNNNAAPAMLNMRHVDYYEGYKKALRDIADYTSQLNRRLFTPVRLNKVFEFIYINADEFMEAPESLTFDFEIKNNQITIRKD